MSNGSELETNLPLAICSAVVLLGVSSILAFLGHPAEMGLAIVAGALGLAFANIDRLQKFEGAGFKAEIREKVQAILEKETEPEPDPRAQTESTFVDMEKKAVLCALGNPKYTWRFLGGLEAESELPSDRVKANLDDFVNTGIARRSRGTKGPIWSLTALGRETLAILLGNADSA